MAKISVTYRAPKGDNKVVEMRGHTFFDGRAEKVDSETEAGLLAKLRTNKHFEVSEKDAPKELLKAVRSAPSANASLIATEQASGAYAVMMGESIVMDGLTKEEADAFNALSVEDKAAYVAA